MAEEREEGVKDEGAVSPLAGLLTREGMALEEVVEVGDCWGWAFRLQGWVARRMRREERNLEEKEDIDVVGPVIAIAVRKVERRDFEVVTVTGKLPLPEQSPRGWCDLKRREIE